MEFKKCARCGCFFMSDDSVCCNCKPKDKFDTIKLQNYLEEHTSPTSLEEISIGTGISIKNLCRFDEIKKLNSISDGTGFEPNISIGL